MLGSLLYAMDTSFYNPLGGYDFDVRCEMLCELGFDATYLTLWETPAAMRDLAWGDLPRLAGVHEHHGLSVAAVYVTLDIGAPPSAERNRRALRVVETVEGCSTVELAVVDGSGTLQPSDPAGDAPALEHLQRLLHVAERRRITLALYPHINHWVQRVADAARLCQAMQHPLLRLVFTGFHWFAVGGTNLGETLAEAAPYLHLANVCGSRRAAVNGLPATIEPLDEGELDNFAVLGALRRVGYAGMLGVQGYSVGGDAYAKLRRSVEAIREMEHRLDAHPSWAELRAI